MQRNILKLALAYAMALFLTIAPFHMLHAAETTVDTNAPHETYHVSAENGLKMRSAPSKDSDVVTLLPYNAKVIVINTENSGWYQVTYSGETGYVAAKYLTKSSETDTVDDTSPNAAETDESDAFTDISPENVRTTLGVTPLIFALIAAIIIMIILAIFTAYSFLKKEKDGYDETEYDDDYDYNYDENDTEQYETNLDSNDDTYMDDEYDEEYYEDDE